MSKFSKDVLGSSNGLFDLIRRRAEQLEVGIHAKLAQLRTRFDRTSKRLDAKREEIRENTYL